MMDTDQQFIVVTHAPCIRIVIGSFDGFFMFYLSILRGIDTLNGYVVRPDDKDDEHAEKIAFMQQSLEEYHIKHQS